jgi:hypothetical protein
LPADQPWHHYQAIKTKPLIRGAAHNEFSAAPAPFALPRFGANMNEVRKQRNGASALLE